MSNTKWVVHIGAGAGGEHHISKIKTLWSLFSDYELNTVSVQDQIDLDQTSVDHQSTQDNDVYNIVMAE